MIQEYLKNMSSRVRQENELYFYWILGHDADINGFYNELSTFISDIELQNIPYIYLNTQDLVNPATVPEVFVTTWKKTVGIFGDYAIEDLRNKETMLQFLRNYVVLMNIEHTNMTLTDLEEALSLIMSMFVKIFYKSYYVEKSKETFMSKLKGFLLKCIYWHNAVIYKSLEKMDLKNLDIIEKIIFYDSVKAEQLLFLCYLRMLGFDVLLIDTEGVKPIRDAYIKDLPVTLISYNYQSSPKPFGTLLKKTDSISSVAVLASKEIETEVFSSDTGLFKPKQLISFEVKAVILRTIFEEIDQILYQEIRFREGFNIAKNIVFSPQLFIKIDGIHHGTIQQNGVAFSKFYEKQYDSWSIRDFPEADFEEIAQCIRYREWTIDAILEHFDVNLGNRLRKNIEILLNMSNGFWNLQNEKINSRKTVKIIESTIKYLLTKNDYVFLLKKIDLPFLSPKIIINKAPFHINGTDKNYFDNRMIIATILLFSFLMGFDVLVFSYTCDVIFENCLMSDVYQKIILEDVYSDAQAQQLIQSIDIALNMTVDKRPSSTLGRILDFFK